MEFFPICTKLKNKKCLVVGGGKVAERKVNVLLKSGAEIEVASPDLTLGLRRLADAGKITYKARKYSASLLKQADLVIAATNNRKVNQQIASGATSLNVPVNVVDSACESTFIFPAILDREGFTIAVSTDGESPALAKAVRDRLNEFFDGFQNTGLKERSELNLKKGKVYLVGAGPGDPELITVKGLNLVKAADVILYDRLISPKLLEHAKRGAELVYAGEKTREHTVRQDEINNLLIRQARKGKSVVRLKGGDPFVFGRGGEEALELLRNGIPFEVVTGVSSFHGVPVSAGIPLTQRGYSSSVGIVTGREDSTKSSPEVQWQKLATAVDTLIILMGVKNLPTIVKELKKGGCSSNRPVAIIRWGTTKRQEILEGTLENIVRKVKKADFKPPAIIVVGETVAFRKQLGFIKEEFTQADEAVK